MVKNFEGTLLIKGHLPFPSGGEHLMGFSYIKLLVVNLAVQFQFNQSVVVRNPREEARKKQPCHLDGCGS